MMKKAPILWLFIVPILAKAKNMNGHVGQYQIANSLGNDNKYSTDYQAEYFEVYSPLIRTRYSEVFWAGMAPVPLPDDIVERFNNKTMAVVGYEVDQVKQGENGQDDVSVPITHAYNHHYMSWLVNSNKARLVKRKASQEMLQAGLTHGSEYHWQTELIQAKETENDEPPSWEGDPLVQFFSEGNGGEFRLSYHGYPKGYAQLIYSPDTFKIAPMQIDTWNREEPSSKYAPGPMPKESGIPPSAGYSGLLECPCSTRIHKEWNMTYTVKQASGVNNQNDCGDEPVASAEECWTSVASVMQASVFRHHLVAVDNSETDSGDHPLGCSFMQHADGTTDVYWNPTKGSSLRKFQSDHDLATATSASNTINNNNNQVAFAATGQLNITVALQDQDKVRITLVGPADRWFGVGFGASTMCRHPESDQCPDGGPYAMIVLGDTVQERMLANHGPGSILTPSTITIESNAVVGNNRTVVITRPKQGTAFSFDPSSGELPIITARGCGTEFVKHCGHGPASLQFVQVETPMSICQAGIQGTIQGRKFNPQGRCGDFPRSDLKQHHNPTCNIETYAGGLFCCHHGMSLLDSDQEIPWADQYLEYHLKFRFYFEDYDPATTGKNGRDQTSDKLATGAEEETTASDAQTAMGMATSASPSHRNLVRLFWATEGNAGEYDIIQCHNNTPASQCVQVITSKFRVQDMIHDCGTHIDGSYCTGKGSSDPNLTEGIELIYAGPHCHAPACLSVELYNANTGQLLCRVEPIYGQSLEVFDEHNYLAIPPCLWGSPEEGLAPPVLLPLDTELLSIKRNNNTLPHTGEMALWQMRGVVIPKQQREETKEEEHLLSSVVGDGKTNPESLASSIEMPSLRRRRDGV